MDKKKRTKKSKYSNIIYKVTSKTFFGRLEVLGEMDWKPITRYGKVIPDYYVSKEGQILSTRTSKPKILNPKYTANSVGEKYIHPRHIGARIPKDFFDDYTYTSAACTNKNTASINIKIHRAVMEVWKPIDENPPIPMQDWIDTPESAKQFIRESANIDHIDADISNNHVDNLRWCTPKQNNPWLKANEANANND